jgi:hypothetical protein
MKHADWVLDNNEIDRLKQQIADIGNCVRYR